ncbi:hypothetical protein ACEYW6_35510 [Nostoc sp. UIC 10607]|uniref:hypothetical protein n=1 Tax=Nostoc sp. UIC 10607 TaxID=3045935 RepID=UPI0039A20B7B
MKTIRSSNEFFSSGKNRRTELEWYCGYPACLAAMVAIAAGLLFFFWHRGWFESFSTTKHD